VLKNIIEQGDEPFLGRIYDLFSSVSYVDEFKLEKFLSLIKEKYADFKLESSSQSEEDWEIDVEKLIVSKEGYEKMKTELNRMVNEEMVNLSKDLAKACNVSGDLKENVEYNALIEKQTILKMTINKLEDEVKKAVILDVNNISLDTVDIGAKVIFEDINTGEKNYFILLGPWDADFEKGILSYRSPIAKELLGKRIGDEINLTIGDDERRLKLSTIEKYC
ncbi:MAG: GreA/GreB family elongation factor, partial [Spirochaetota bacterium]|nr:GreA/GreB family elongation factor [Spirochaetota bacterium]